MREARLGLVVAGRTNCMCKVYIATSHLYTFHMLFSLPFSSLPSQPTTHTHTQLTYAHFLIFLLDKFLFIFQNCSNAPSITKLSLMPSFLASLAEFSHRPYFLKEAPFLFIEALKSQKLCLREIPVQNSIMAPAITFFPSLPKNQKGLDLGREAVSREKL